MYRDRSRGKNKAGYHGFGADMYKWTLIVMVSFLTAGCCDLLTSSDEPIAVIHAERLEVPVGTVEDVWHQELACWGLTMPVDGTTVYVDESVAHDDDGHDLIFTNSGNVVYGYYSVSTRRIHIGPDAMALRHEVGEAIAWRMFRQTVEAMNNEERHLWMDSMRSCQPANMMKVEYSD